MDEGIEVQQWRVRGRREPLERLLRRCSGDSNGIVRLLSEQSSDGASLYGPTKHEPVSVHQAHLLGCAPVNHDGVGAGSPPFKSRAFDISNELDIRRQQGKRLDYLSLQYYNRFGSEGEQMMGETLRQIAEPAIEGMLALAAALSAIAFRRRTRMFTPAGFIMLALGLTLDLMVPHGPRSPEWARYLRAAAIVLLWFGVVRLGVESIEFLIRRRRVHVSTLATELALTVLYAAIVLLVTLTILSFDLRRLIALPALFTLARAWLQQRDLFSGLLIQANRPFKPGDWVRFGSQVGQVQGTGWRGTRILTRAHESVAIPSGMLAREVLTNYSAGGRVADEVFVKLPGKEPPGEVEEIVRRMLDNIPEILKEPPPEVSPWEYCDDTSLLHPI